MVTLPVHRIQICLLMGTGCSCRAGPQRDPEVISKVGNMWFNPKLPDAKPRRAKSGPSSPARPLAQRAAGTPTLSQCLHACVMLTAKTEGAW